MIGIIQRHQGPVAWVVGVLLVLSAAGASAITLEFATISKGGAVLPGGSVAVIGQVVSGTMEGALFKLDVGFVPLLPMDSSCPPSSPASPELIGAEVSTKNRFLSFTPGDVGRTQAVRITFVDLPAPFNIWNGQVGWVGQPSAVSEAGVTPVPSPDFPTFQAAMLQCSPLFTDWSAVGTLHVFNEGIVPLGTYRIQVIDQACDVGSESSYSLPLDMGTAKWGDTLRDLATVPPPPPDGSVTVIDVLGLLGRFISDSDSIVKARADLEPACLDLVINISDALFALNGFQGLPYPFEPMSATPCASSCPNPIP